jgi:glutathionylspermidine synthase
MLRKVNLKSSPAEQISALGWEWMFSEDLKGYITDNVLAVSDEEGGEYYTAANDLYELLLQTVQHVLDNDLLDSCGIPKSLHQLIRKTWENDALPLLYARFDLAGGLDGKAIKFIEINPDTPTCVAETAVVQWAQLKANRLDETFQFNALFESLTEQWRFLHELNPDKKRNLLISYIQDVPEDFTSVNVIGEAAKKAGFQVEYAYMHETEFNEYGVFRNENGVLVKFDYWFKLVPWFWIANDEPDLLLLLEKQVLENHTLIMNPPYSALLESKALLKYVFDLFPEHPLVLKASFEPLKCKQAAKPFFGREGENVKILDDDGHVLKENAGECADMPHVYQEFYEFMRDENAYCQAGVFLVNEEACALSFRLGSEILDNSGRFLGHFVD